MLVVDASVAVKFVAQEDGSDAAYEIVDGPEVLIALDWTLVEVASALWKKVKFSRLLAVHAEDNLDCLPKLFERLYPAEPLLAESLKLAFRLRHPIYDCLYLALAIREDADVITADREFHRACQASVWKDRVHLLKW
ncbi:type II toxin-antitoxin system VapC family toxin [Sphingomonas sp. PB4P5]|uniref:type II toxin-antitoxin system VapC family toxin n=1 Tax=Parasphingomonas puruogangriensis TaxID=3096155 RepID=UPI002FC97F94